MPDSGDMCTIEVFAVPLPNLTPVMPSSGGMYTIEVCGITQPNLTPVMSGSGGMCSFVEQRGCHLGDISPGATD